MESTTKNRKTRAQIEGMVARALRGARLSEGEGSLRELTQGWFNATYQVRLADGREMVLKIAPPEAAEVMQYEQAIMATEVASLRLVRTNPAIPVPEIYAYDDSHEIADSDYFFMERIRGEYLALARASLSSESLAAIELHSGAIIREVNGFRGTSFGYEGNPALRSASWREAFIQIVEAVLEDADRKNARLDFTRGELRAALLSHASALEEVSEPRLVHWDAWDPNLFIRGDRVVGIIDFERALWADPLMEAQFRELGEGGVTNSMRGYGKTAFTREEELRMHLYSLHLALTMYTECSYRTYDTDDIRRFARAFLGRTMAWLKAH